MKYSSERVARNAALVATHPTWHGVRHPDRLDFSPPRRHSARSILPAVERAGARNADLRAANYSRRRVDRIADVVAAHPQWHGIRHPERLDFVLPPDEYRLRRDLAAAIRAANESLARSERIAARLTTIADGADTRLAPFARPGPLSPPTGASAPAAPAGAPPPRVRRFSPHPAH